MCSSSAVSHCSAQGRSVPAPGTLLPWRLIPHTFIFSVLNILLFVSLPTGHPSPAAGGLLLSVFRSLASPHTLIAPRAFHFCTSRNSPSHFSSSFLWVTLAKGGGTRARAVSVRPSACFYCVVDKPKARAYATNLKGLQRKAWMGGVYFYCCADAAGCARVARLPRFCSF